MSINSFEKLKNLIAKKNSILCVGLDPDINKLPAGIAKNLDGVYEFLIKIIDSTLEIAAAFKVNFAFFEQFGSPGFALLERLSAFIWDKAFTIADAKRGDIGNTSKAYAKACFESLGFDSVTVNPYMGKDSVEPFLEFKNKFVFLLALTSNPGSSDFQRLVSSGKPVYRHVIEQSSLWTGAENLGYVVGATHPQELSEIRKYTPGRLMLIPGVGTQGGDINAVLSGNGSNPAIINVSRAVLYAQGSVDFAKNAYESALYYKNRFNNEDYNNEPTFNQRS